MKSQNLLIIIGNGFDVAHNLPTTYGQFLEYLLKKIFDNLPSTKTPVTEEMCEGYFKKSFLENRTYFIHERSAEYNFVETIGRTNIDSIQGETADDTLKRRHYEFFMKKENTSSLKFVLSNKFLAKLYINKLQYWYEIEKQYFDILLTKINPLLLRQSKNQNEPYLQQVKDLNKELDFIKDELKNYLKTLTPAKNSKISTFFEDLVKESNPYILNFNYTNTLNLYFDSKIINHIHGTLNSDILFGYGNDFHDKYNDIKDLGLDDLLTNFKTSQYNNSNNYQGFFNDFIDTVPRFDVAVIGHSLGQTDKTILREIFDDPKCEKIYLFSRSDVTNPIEQLNKLQKVQKAASRIIAKNQDSRLKIINAEQSKSFP
jgi:hypothetical protein